MQRVEKMRDRSELSQSADGEWALEAHRLAADVALQWRQLAEEGHALAAEREFDSPLRWSPSWASDPDDAAEPPKRPAEPMG